MLDDISLHRAEPGVGPLLRGWRERRRVTQLDLALDAEISARHLSFIETGRARPSRDMVLRLAERLDVPLRERSRLLLAAGFAPAFRERRFDDPDAATARAAIERLLAAHRPYPALAVDRHWNLLTANDAALALLADVPADLLQPPVNVLRLSLDPRALGGRIENIGDWRAHLFARLERQIQATGDPELAALLATLRALPAPPLAARDARDAVDELVVPLRLRVGERVLAFVTTTMMFGAPRDVLLAEIAIEVLLPADEATARALLPGA